MSFSAVSSRSNDNDDLRELIRAASARIFGDWIDVEAILGRQKSGSVRKPSLGLGVVPKKTSVRMGRLDEDGPCEFNHGGAEAMRLDQLYPRSRSCAIASARGILEAEEEEY